MANSKGNYPFWQIVRETIHWEKLSRKTVDSLSHNVFKSNQYKSNQVHLVMVGVA